MTEIVEQWFFIGTAHPKIGTDGYPMYVADFHDAMAVASKIRKEGYSVRIKLRQTLETLIVDGVFNED